MELFSIRIQRTFQLVSTVYIKWWGATAIIFVPFQILREFVSGR